MNSRIRCAWAEAGPLMRKYHDREWGVPVHDDLRLFELLLLEGAQAGLSWSTILNKRENYRAAFDGFDAEKLARYGPNRIERLLSNAGIVRNRLKIESAVANARAFLEVKREFGSFDDYLWRFVDNRPIRNAFASMKEIPARSPESDALAKDLKRRGFKFTGTTICYAYMQAVGMVNDHVTSCFRYRTVSKMK